MAKKHKRRKGLAPTRIRQALHLAKPEQADQFVAAVRERTGRERLEYFLVADLLEIMRASDRTVENVAREILLRDLGQRGAQSVLEELAKALNVNLPDAKEFAANIRADCPMPVTTEDLLRAVRAVERKKRTSGNIINELSVSVIGRNLALSREEAGQLAPMLTELTQIPVDHQDIITVLADHDSVSQAFLIEYFSQRATPVLELASALETTPAEAWEFMHKLQAKVTRPFTAAEVMRAISDIDEGPVTVERISWRLMAPAITRAHPGRGGRSRFPAATPARTDRAGGSQFRRAGTQTAEEDEPVTGRVDAIRLVANDLRLSYPKGAEYVDRIHDLAGGQATYADILAAHRDSPRKTVAATADLVRERLIARTLGSTEDEVGKYRAAIAAAIGRPVSVAEMAAVLPQLGAEPTLIDVTAQLIGREKPILDIAAALGQTASGAREAVARIGRALGQACDAEEIASEIQRLAPDDRSEEAIVRELQVARAASEFGVDRDSFAELVGYVHQELGTVPPYRSIGDAIKVCADDTSFTNIVTVLGVANRLGRMPSQVSFLWRSVKRQTGVVLQLQDFAALTEALPVSRCNEEGLISFLRLREMLPGVQEYEPALQELHGQLNEKRQLQRRFFSLAERFDSGAPSAVSDLQMVLEMASWPTSGVDIMLPNAASGEGWLTASALQNLQRKSSHTFEDAAVLSAYAMLCWTEIRSEQRRYGIPSRGRAEILASKRLRDVWGLQSLRFVQEGAHAPDLFVQFNFGEPARLGPLWLKSDGTAEGFHTLSDDPWLQALFPTIALAYYRDLVIPGPVSVATEHKHGQNYHHPHTAAVSSKRHANVLPRRPPTPRQKIYDFEAWHIAQVRARHHVTGHTRWVGEGFIADREKQRQARMAGVPLPVGYTWVIEHERGNPQHSGGVELDEQFDLVHHTIFRAPVSATRILELLLF